MRLELLSKEKDEKKEEHVAKIVEVKDSIIVAIQKAKIKLVEGVANARSWNVAGWCEAQAKLTGEPLNTSLNLAGQLKVGGQGEEAQKVLCGDDQIMVQV